MTQIQETHINAFYDDLATAKIRVLEAQGEVARLETIIVERGGTLPVETPTEVVEPTADVNEPIEVSETVEPKANKEKGAK